MLMLIRQHLRAMPRFMLFAEDATPSLMMPIPHIENSEIGMLQCRRCHAALPP